MTTNAKRKNRHKKAKSAAGTASTAGTAAARMPEQKQQQQQQSTRSPPCYVDDSLDDDGGSCCGHTHAHVNDGEHMHGYNDTQGYSTHGEMAHSHHYNPSQKHRSAYDSDSNASNCWREAVQPDKNKLRQFWLQLPETSRRQLMVVEKDVLMSRMRQHQRRACRCEFCGVPKALMDDELEQLYDSFYGQLQSTLDDVNASLPPIVCKTQLPPMPQQAAPWPPRSNGEQRQQSATWSSRPNSSQLSQGRAGASATNTTKGNYKQSAASALDTAARNVPLPALNTVSQQGASLDVPQPVDPQLTRMSSAQTSSSAMLGQVLPVSSTLPLTAPFTGRNVYSADAINAMTTKMAGETGVGMARVAAGVIAASVSTQTGARQPPPPPEGHPDDVVVPPLPIEPSIRSTDELPAMTSGLLTLADDLLQNDGRKFLEMMERLALHQRYMHDGTAAEDAELDYAAAYADMDDAHLGGTFPPALHEYIDDGVTGEEDEDDDEDDDCDDEEDFDDDDLDDDGADDEVFFREDIGDADNDLGEEDDEDYFSSEHDDDDDSVSSLERMEEGRRMFQIIAAKIFEERVIQAYQEKVTAENQERLLRELEEEETLTKQQEEKKRAKNQKKKDKLRQKKEEEERKEAERMRKEEEERLVAEEAARVKREAAEMERLRQEAVERQRREAAEAERRRLEEAAAEKRRKAEEKAAKEEKARMERERKKQLAVEREELRKLQLLQANQAKAAAAAAKVMAEREAAAKAKAEREAAIKAKDDADKIAAALAFTAAASAVVDSTLADAADGKKKRRQRKPSMQEPTPVAAPASALTEAITTSASTTEGKSLLEIIFPNMQQEASAPANGHLYVDKENAPASANIATTQMMGDTRSLPATSKTSSPLPPQVFHRSVESPMFMQQPRQTMTQATTATSVSMSFYDNMTMDASQVQQPQHQYQQQHQQVHAAQVYAAPLPPPAHSQQAYHPMFGMQQFAQQPQYGSRMGPIGSKTAAVGFSSSAGAASGGAFGGAAASMFGPSPLVPGAGLFPLGTTGAYEGAGGGWPSATTGVYGQNNQLPVPGQSFMPPAQPLDYGGAFGMPPPQQQMSLHEQMHRGGTSSAGYPQQQPSFNNA